MSKTLADIRQSVRINLQREVPNRVFRDIELDDAINEGQNIISQSLNDELLFSIKQESYITADGTSISYDLPTNFLRIYAVEDSDNNSYYPVEIRHLNRRDEILSLKEQYIFAIWNNGIYLYTPTGAVGNTVEIHIFYIKKPIVLSSPTDTCDLSDDLVRLVINYATGIALGSYPDKQKRYLDLFWGEAERMNNKFEPARR